jgi:hypothetical protein
MAMAYAIARRRGSPMIASRMLLAGVMIVSSLFAGSISHAASLTFAYEGTVNSTGGFPDSGPFDAFLGETIRVEYTFDTTTPDSNGSSNGDYFSAVTAAEITIGSNVYTATGGNIIIINNGVNPDQYIVDVDQGLAGPAVGGQLPDRFQVILTDTTKTFFSSDALPTVQPDPLGFTSSVLQFDFCSSGCADFGFINAANPVIPAPEPVPSLGPLALVLLPCLLVLITRRFLTCSH